MHTEVISATRCRAGRAPSRGAQGRGADGRVPWPPGWMRTSRAGAFSREWWAPRTRFLAPTDGRAAGATAQEMPQPSSGWCCVQYASTSQGPTASSSSTPSKSRSPMWRWPHRLTGRGLVGLRAHGVRIGGCACARQRRRSAAVTGRALDRPGQSAGFGRCRGSDLVVRSQRAGRPGARAAHSWPHSSSRPGTGRPAAWCVRGEPGVGKSALLERARRRRPASRRPWCCAPRASRSRRRWRSRPSTGCCCP